LASDAVDLFEAAANRRLAYIEPRWDPRAAVGVVMAAGGYPGAYRKGDPIAGLDAAPDGDVKVFHAGTRATDEAVVTAGGRVLCVTALGADVAAARAKVYAAVAGISWADAHYRQDIGHRALER
jgi:phosphoribosylamine--glycine ligase